MDIDNDIQRAVIDDNAEPYIQIYQHPTGFIRKYIRPPMHYHELQYFDNLLISVSEDAILLDNGKQNITIPSDPGEKYMRGRLLPHKKLLTIQCLDDSVLRLQQAYHISLYDIVL